MNKPGLLDYCLYRTGVSFVTIVVVKIIFIRWAYDLSKRVCISAGYSLINVIGADKSKENNISCAIPFQKDDKMADSIGIVLFSCAGS